jgi:hypothetical protein
MFVNMHVLIFLCIMYDHVMGLFFYTIMANIYLVVCFSTIYVFEQEEEGENFNVFIFCAIDSLYVT